MDMLTALVSGLAHQQVANDPGGRRWVRLADQVVDMLLAGIDKHPSSPVSKHANPRREPA